jgi:hypothetical protein
MPWVGFEPMIPVSERANTVNALDRAATVIGIPELSTFYIHTIYIWIWTNVEVRTVSEQRYKNELTCFRTVMNTRSWCVSHLIPVSSGSLEHSKQAYGIL